MYEICCTVRGTSLRVRLIQAGRLTQKCSGVLTASICESTVYRFFSLRVGVSGQYFFFNFVVWNEYRDSWFLLVPMYS